LILLYRISGAVVIRSHDVLNDAKLQFDQQRREIDKSLNSGTAHSRMARGLAFQNATLQKNTR
jgi:hypothetical protein